MRWLVIVAGLLVVSLIFRFGTPAYYLSAFIIFMLSSMVSASRKKGHDYSTDFPRDRLPEVDEAKLPRQAHSPPPIQPTSTAGIAILIVVIAALVGLPFLLFHLKPKNVDRGANSSREEAGSDTMPTRFFSDVWSPDAVEARLFPALQIAEFRHQLDANAQMREAAIAAKLFCAYQWDLAKFQKAETKLSQNGLLQYQWDPELRGMNDSILDSSGRDLGSYFRTVSTGWLLLVDDATTNTSKPGIPERWKPFVPDRETRIRVRRELEVDAPYTVPNPKPVEFLLHDRSPRVSLITDHVGSLSLKNLIELERLLTSGFAERLQKAYASLLGREEFQVPTFEPHLMLSTVMFSFEVTTGLHRRDIMREESPLDGWTDLKDLNVYFLQSEKLPTELQERNAYYDRRSSCIFSRLNNNGTQTAPLDLVPAELFHELSHYLFSRALIDGTRFLAEGEATAYGERAHQIMMAAFEHERTDAASGRLALFSLLDPSITNTERDRLKQEYLKAMASVPLTAEQKQLIRDLAVSGITAAEIERELTLPPEGFEKQSEQSLAYARGWIIYHIDLLEDESSEFAGLHQQRRRARDLENMAHKLRPLAIGANTPAIPQDLSETDRKRLNELAEEASTWIDNHRNDP